MAKSDRYIARVNGLNIALIPKNGNSSIRWALLSHFNIPPQQGNRHHAALNLCGIDDAPVGSVAFVRDPYARAVSAWADKIRNTEQIKGALNMQETGFTLGAGFKKYVSELKALRDKDVHTRPQSSFVRDDFRLYRFEDLEIVWAKLRRQNLWLHDIGHDRKTTIRPASNRCVDEIRELYADDYELWQSIECMR